MLGFWIFILSLFAGIVAVPAVAFVDIVSFKRVSFSVSFSAPAMISLLKVADPLASIVATELPELRI